MNFYLIINGNKDKELSVTNAVADFLLAHKSKVFVEKSFSEFLDNSKLTFFEPDDFSENIDAAIVIGGDGTILRAAKILCSKNIPIIGVNLGKVGYMAELEINECELMLPLFSQDENIKNQVILDERMMLSCQVIRDGKTVYSGICLNEVVVGKGDVSRMVDLSLIHNNQVLAKYQCDGIIASTPTGSTAYSMSAGGAIIDPSIECISVLPLSPYLCINSSPIIFSKKSKIELVYHRVRRNSAYLSIDGEKALELQDGDKVCIFESEYTTKLLRFKKTDFYKVLNTKLANRISELADRM